MTRTANARIAGVTSFVYLSAGIAGLALAGRPHATDVPSVFTSLSALVMGVTLYAITREQGPELALFGLVCRAIEGASLPMLVFEVAPAIWFLARGVRAPLLPAPAA